MLGWKGMYWMHWCAVCALLTHASQGAQAISQRTPSVAIELQTIQTLCRLKRQLFDGGLEPWWAVRTSGPCMSSCHHRVIIMSSSCHPCPCSSCSRKLNRVCQLDLLIIIRSARRVFRSFHFKFPMHPGSRPRLPGSKPRIQSSACHGFRFPVFANHLQYAKQEWTTCTTRCKAKYSNQRTERKKM